MRNLLLVLLLFFSLASFSQSVTITHTGITPNQGGVQKLNYDQIRQLSSPQEGDLVYDLTFKCLRHYTGSQWLCVNQQNEETPNVSLLKLLPAKTWLTQGVTISKISVDFNQNIVVCGSFEGTVNFGSTTLSPSAEEMFVVKYNKYGDELWVNNQATEIGGTVTPKDLEIDAQGNIYVYGNFSNTVTFGSETLTPGTIYDGFLLKYDPNGDILFSKQIETNAPGQLSIGNLEVDQYQNIFICGDFSHTITFGPGNDLVSNPSLSRNTFVVKYNNAGSFVWKKQFISPQDLQSILAINTVGEVYLGLNYNTSLSHFAATTYFSTGLTDFALLKFSPGGTFLWAERSNGSGNEYIKDLIVNGTSVYVLAKSNAAFSFLNQNFNISNTTYQQIKFNGFSRNFLWKKAFNSGFESIENEAITIDNQGNTHIFSTAYGGIQEQFEYFGNLPLIDIPYEGTSAIFMAKIDGQNQNIVKKIMIDGPSNDHFIDAITTTTGSFLIGYTNEFGIRVGGVLIPPNNAFILQTD